LGRSLQSISNEIYLQGPHISLQHKTVVKNNFQFVPVALKIADEIIESKSKEISAGS